MTDSSTAYIKHVRDLNTRSGKLLRDARDLLIHSGSEHHYFGDDRGINFQSFGHFLHWLPVNRPDQFVLIREGRKPRYLQVVPQDFWYDQSLQIDPALVDAIGEEFEVITLRSTDQVAQHIDTTKTDYIGPEAQWAKSLGLASCNETALLAPLDFARAEKSEYELEQLRIANRQGLAGHAAAVGSFLNGGSEFDIHSAFLGACGLLEYETPYTNIVGLNANAAILHYQHKARQAPANSQLLLIDAGSRVNGYGSDITRTTASPSCHPVMASLIEGMTQLELDIVASVKPGIDYPQLHAQALAGVAALLVEHGLSSLSAQELIERELVQKFMPHGVGHLLGVQVHDVGGHQAQASGGRIEPPAHSPALRCTRTLTENMVFTIEPGLYFIPMLLDPLRSGAAASAFDWQLIDALIPVGGIRIEDNIRVTADGAENLTRQPVGQG